MYMGKKITLGEILVLFIMIVVLFVTLYPFIYVVSMSLSAPEHVLSRQVYFLPKGLSVEAYRVVLKEKDVWISLFNSVWYTVVGTITSIVLTCMGSYVLSRRHFFLRKQLMFLFTLTMFISGGLIPFYVVVCRLGLHNSRWSIILPYAVSTYNLIVTRTYFESIPESIAESARIDGANEWTIMTRLFMPLAKPIIAVLVLFYGVGYWNSYFAPLIFLTDKNLQPIQVYLRNLLIQSQMVASSAGSGGFARAVMNEQLKYSTIVLAIVPISLIYPFVQKHLVQGILIGSIKE